MQLPPKLSAVISAILFASTLGVLIVVAAFGFIRLLEQMGEGLGLVPTRWGENNPDLLFEISTAIGLPVVIWFVVWFYKKAVAAETSLMGYRYTPPAEPKQGGKV
jgi:hypothetical protein